MALRVIGTCLLLGALLLPWAATLRRARLLPPPPGRTLHLRPELMVLPANHGNQPPVRPFAITTTRVTEEQFRAVLDRPPPSAADRDKFALSDLDRPPPPAADRGKFSLRASIESMTSAVKYCHQLSTLEGWPPCDTGSRGGCLGYRLPTADELAYAARADLPEASKETPNRWGLAVLDPREKLASIDESGQGISGGGVGFVVVRTCPDPPQPCGRPKQP